MRYEWDKKKSDENLRTRGFDFAHATLIFDGRVRQHEDRRRDYGEHRVIATGVAEGRLLTVVYTDRDVFDGLVRRIISARLSNPRERHLYGQAHI